MGEVMTVDSYRALLKRIWACDKDAQNKVVEIYIDSLLLSIDRLRHQLEPEVPKLLQDYRANKSSNSDYTVRDEFWRQPDIYRFTNESSRIDSVNRGNYEHLLRLNRFIPENREADRIKVVKYINEYKTFWSKIRDRHRGYLFHNQHPTEEQRSAIMQPVVITQETQDFFDKHDFQAFDE